jgi:hypothetical protein
VRRRTFAYFLDDHHGDGEVALTWKARPGEGEALAGADPARFFRPAYLGARGWGALRLDLEHTDWGEVAGFVADSYVAVAPRRLAALVA